MDETKPQSGSLQFQDRDFALLRGLFECRVMTADHVATLYFDGKREYTKKRLQKIKAAGLIGERKRRVNEPSVLFLTRRAFLLLKSLGRLSGYPSLGANSFEARATVSELTLRHELEIMDVKASFHSALSKSDRFSIVEFTTWPRLYQFAVSKGTYGTDTPVKPDGFIRIHEKEAGTKGFAHDCFLEVDRSSETQDTLAARASCYVEYYRSGGFAKWNGAELSDYKDYPYRVLMVLKTAERRNNTAERLLQNNPPILTQVCLSTMAEVASNPLGAIWIRPLEYRVATAGTLFSSDRPTPSFGYRRQPEREKLVEDRIQKHCLLDG